MSCKAVCHIYSGRPDPGWELTNKQTEEAFIIWNNLEEASFREGFPSILGYRGVSVTCEDGRVIFVFNKMVRAEVNNTTKWKADENRELEKYLLSTAPEKALPGNVIPEIP